MDLETRSYIVERGFVEDKGTATAAEEIAQEDSLESATREIG